MAATYRKSQEQEQSKRGLGWFGFVLYSTSLQALILWTTTLMLNFTRRVAYFNGVTKVKQVFNWLQNQGLKWKINQC